MAALRLWQKMWILFTVICLVVGGLMVGTILAFSDRTEWNKAIRPGLLAVAVPAILYLVGLGWQAWKRHSGSEPE